MPIDNPYSVDEHTSFEPELKDYVVRGGFVLVVSILTILIFVDDGTGIGVLDDCLIPVAGELFTSGISFMGYDYGF